MRILRNNETAVNRDNSRSENWDGSSSVNYDNSRSVNRDDSSSVNYGGSVSHCYEFSKAVGFMTSVIHVCSVNVEVSAYDYCTVYCHVKPKRLTVHSESVNVIEPGEYKNI